MRLKILNEENKTGKGSLRVARYYREEGYLGSPQPPGLGGISLGSSLWDNLPHESTWNKEDAVPPPHTHTSMYLCCLSIAVTKDLRSSTYFGSQVQRVRSMVSWSIILGTVGSYASWRRSCSCYGNREAKERASKGWGSLFHPQRHGPGR